MNGAIHRELCLQLTAQPGPLPGAAQRDRALPLPETACSSCAAVSTATSLPSWQVGWRNSVDRKLILGVGRGVGGASLFLFSHIRNPAQLTAALYGYESLLVSLRIGENSRYLAFTERQMQIFFLPCSLTNSFIILSLLKFFLKCAFFMWPNFWVLFNWGCWVFSLYVSLLSISCEFWTIDSIKEVSCSFFSTLVTCRVSSYGRSISCGSA